MGLGRMIGATALKDLVKSGAINKEGVRLLDCTYAVGPKPDYRKFRELYYGKFKEILALDSQHKRVYSSAHIPGAVHANLDAAMYPTQYERFALYPPELFQEYARILGINDGEHLVLYSRGPLNGMMFAAKVAWLFQSYGVSPSKLSLLDGGISAYQNAAGELSSQTPQLSEGNFTSVDKIKQYNITFEELEARPSDALNGGKKKVEEPIQARPTDDWCVTEENLAVEKKKEEPSDPNDKQYIERTDEVNFLDARGRGQFNGTEETGLDPYQVSGSHIPGFKNTPSGEMLSTDGTLKGNDEIKKWLSGNGYTAGQPIVTNCNTGMMASLLSYRLLSAMPDQSVRLYNGSLKEMEQRDPKKISAGRKDLPH